MFNLFFRGTWGVALFFLMGTAFALKYPLDCHPQIDAALPQYIIGYGSLINEESKRRTAPLVGDNLPIYLTGYERGWFLQGTNVGFSTTFLGVKKNAKAKMNAVIFYLPDHHEINALDTREMNYCRVLVNEDAIQLLTSQPLPKAQYWMYMPPAHKLAIADEKHPITQGYVDLFLSGCLRLEKKYKLDGFAHDCITTTSNWSTHWVNDRIFPRRPWVYVPDAIAIDNMLLDTIPACFNSIKIEQAR